MSKESYTGDARPAVGDRVLVRLNFCDEEGTIIRQQQFKGLIDRITVEEVVIKHPERGTEVSLPPHFGSYVRAERGSYELPSTGETMIDPDYITEWTLRDQSGE